MRLTETAIRKLPPPSRGNRIHYDDLVKGLGLRITAASAKAFILNYRIHGRERRMTIGAWPEWSATAAREHAKELRRAIDRGEDPLAEKEQLRVDPTFGELVAEYFEVKAKSQKGRDNYSRMLEKDVLPKWKRRRAADIKRRDVIKLIEAKAQSAPVTANRLFELLRRIFNFAISRDIVEANPCAQVEKPTKEKSKDRVLTSDEIRAFWSTLDGPGFSPQSTAALRLILVTAQRPGEVASMQWQDVDLESNWWTIPAENAKNTLSHRVPLNKTARAILTTLPRVSSWVFPSPKEGQHLHRNALAMALRRARQREENPLTVMDFSPHDLRRTAASHMASAGVQRFVIGRVLNHAEPGVTQVYDRHSYDPEKYDALDRWDRLLRSTLGRPETSRNVVPFREIQ